jgi:hypothetical protein
MSKTFRVPSRYVAAQRNDDETYQVLDVYYGEERLANLDARKYDVVATGLDYDAAMDWIRRHDQERGQKEANRIAGL